MTHLTQFGKRNPRHIQIHCLGLSHRTAPVALREKLSYTADELQEALTWAKSQTNLRGLAVLSTCNRLELYAYVDDYRSLRDFLAVSRGVCARTLEPHLYHYDGMDAARHLCRVAAGLDSMVLGEPQILGQVTNTYETAVAAKTTGPLLNLLFRTAITAGKRARTETDIGRNSVSVSSASVALADRIAGGLADKSVLVVGAGQMAQLALKVLRSRDVNRITIANRTAGRAHRLADQYGLDAAYALADLPAALADADVVLAATGAPGMVIRPTMLADDRDRPLTLIDLAVPRDVDPAVGEQPAVTLCDVDDLRAQADTALSERQAEIPRVEEIIQHELVRFAVKARQAAVRPIIADLRQQADRIRQKELERVYNYLPADVDDETRRQFEYFSQSLVKKLLHEPTIRLRQEAGEGDGEMYAHSVRYLFGLDEVDLA